MNKKQYFALTDTIEWEKNGKKLQIIRYLNDGMRGNFRRVCCCRCRNSNLINCPK